MSVSDEHVSAAETIHNLKLGTIHLGHVSFNFGIVC